jgi:ElaB/YqjD/DUF883 family membrane-anchored ribosome-binding protein
MTPGTDTPEAMAAGIPEPIVTTTPEPAPKRSAVKAEVSRLKTETAGKARSAAEEGKTKAAETLASVSQATRDAAAKLKGGEAAAIADYVERAADSIDDFADRMRMRSVDDLIDDAREIVRRSPVVVIAVAAAAGFLLSRFLRSSAREQDDWA